RDGAVDPRRVAARGGRPRLPDVARRGRTVGRRLLLRALRRPSRHDVPPAEGVPEATRGWIAQAFAYIEDGVYVGLGLLLACAAIALLVDAGVQFARILGAGERLQPSVVDLLDRLLLILMLVEVMYTVQVSFREHSLVPEPFLIVGLVA